MANKQSTVVVKLPSKPLPAKDPWVCAEHENSNSIQENIDVDNQLFDDVSMDVVEDVHEHVPVGDGKTGVIGGEDIPASQSILVHTGGALEKNVSGVGLEVAKARRVPNARQVEYGGFTYASLSKCLKALGLCRDRFKYLKRTRKELTSDKAIIGLLLQEKQKNVQQATSYVIAIQGEVMFETNLTAACTRVNQLLQLSPKDAMTQGKVSKYKYEWNSRTKNRDRPINLYEAFAACLTNALIRHKMLSEADKAIFKARMDLVGKDTNGDDDLFDVVGEDDSHIEALKDLAEQYHKLGK